MKTLYLVLAILFTALGVVFTVLPMDTLAFLPIGLAMIFGLLALRKTEGKQKKIANVLLVIGAICSVTVIGKAMFIEDKVEKDPEFEKQKIENNQEAKKELEELEGLE